ncbi:phosphatidylethanolamine-binding protein YbcL [Labrys miyagiensis]|uniref:Phosphatidylethanolamine-binding protein YbcL n=1 Tax=Labrys miyagiensis TaxID=346912 RepID=A0ABQ6CG34_9HYPH|nr:YbhB/YbcL family Raf kinase inhibitor-like protein [Labrys miyagiensis]GLS18885.1 phosphatidylethanolamine-binding protein YbcL [Labrys miyagiensis]
MSAVKKIATVLATLPLACGALAQAAYAGAATFTVSSPDLSSGRFDKKFILNGFGCTGSNVSPAIEWSNVPEGTKSLALQVLDPDAPTGSGFWHWAVYNIPATAPGLPQGAGNTPSSLPAPAFGGANDFLDTGATGGNGNYGGPCPPVGDIAHHFVFTLYALSVADVEAVSGIPKSGSPALHSFILNKGLGDKILGKASFVATFGR